jgi:hypothetical protein
LQLNNDGLVRRPTCPLCGAGESSVHHWLTFCPVTNAILSILLNCNNTRLQQWCPITHRDLSLVGYTIFHIKRELVALRAFGHGKYAPPLQIAPGNQARLVKRLLQTICASIPYVISHSIIIHNNNSLVSTICEYETCLYTSRVAPQLNCDLQMRKSARQLHAISSFTHAPGDTLPYTCCRFRQTWAPT